MRLRIAAFATLVVAWSIGTADGGPNPDSRVRVVAQTSDTRIEDIQQSADGTRLITHDRRYSPRLWDAKSLRLLTVLGGHPVPVRWVSFSPDGKSILTLDATEGRFWDAQKGKVRQIFATPEGLIWRRAAFSPDGKLCAIGTEQGPVFLVPTDGSKMRKLAAHSDTVEEVAFSPDGKSLVSASRDGTAKILSVESGQVVQTLSGHSGTVRWAFFSPDGKEVGTTDLEGNARVFNASTGKLLYKLGHFIGGKGFVPTTNMAAQWVKQGDQTRFLVAGEDGTMTLHDASTGAKTGELKGHEGIVREIRITRDGTKAATYADDETLRVWDVGAAKELPFQRATALPTAGEFSPDGTVFWIGASDGSIWAHDLASGKARSQMLAAVLPLFGGGVSADGRRFWATSNGRVQSWATDSPNSMQRFGLTGGSLTFSPDGRYLFRRVDDGSDEGTDDLFLADAATGKEIAGFGKVVGARFSPDSKRILTFEKGAVSFINDCQTGKVVVGLKWDQEGDLTDGVLLPDGVRAATAGHPGDKVFVWEVDGGKTLMEVTPEIGKVLMLACSKDGNRLAMVGQNGVMVVDLATETVLLQVKGPWETRPLAVDFDRSGASLVVTGRRMVRTWDVRSKVEQPKPVVLPILDYDDLASAIHPEGGKLLVPEGNRVVLLDLATGKTIREHVAPDRVLGAFFVGDGRRFASVDPANGFTFWDTETGRKQGQFLIMWGGTWLALDSEGRFDTTDPSQIDGAHCVLEWEGGLEPIELPQLKSIFYEPGLLAKIAGLDDVAPRSVPNLDELRLFPTIDLKRTGDDGQKVVVAMSERDAGGIGSVVVSINGKDVQTKKGVGYFTVDLKDYQAFMLPEPLLAEGQGNQLAVRATNERGDLVSPTALLDVGVPKGLAAPEVRLWALFVGAGDYVGSSSDLAAPPNDAKKLAAAVTEAAERLLPGRVQTRTLVTDDPERIPTKARIKAWFDEVAERAASSDIVVVFFAGHGVSRIGDARDYFFLTPDVNPAEIDPLAGSTLAISGSELRQYLSAISAAKQVVVLDTCHSGAAATNLLGQARTVSGDYERAYEAIKDATGTWLLAGTAADQLSYESGNVEHGLLTYSLLEAIDKASPDGLRPAADDRFFVDVERWLKYAAERVDSLKQEVGLAGIQRPELRRSTSGSSFDIGITPLTARGSIGLKPPKPIVLLGEFADDLEDPLQMEDGVRRLLKASSVLKFWPDVSKHPNAYRLAGRYTASGGTVKLKVAVQWLDSTMTRKTVESFDVEGKDSEIGQLLQSVVMEAEKRIDVLEKARADQSQGDQHGPSGSGTGKS